MPHSFTVTFTHNNNSYTAVVAQWQRSVRVYIPDESLHPLLPHGRFSYDAQQGVNINATKRSLTQNLLLDVLTAIEMQTQTKDASHV